MSTENQVSEVELLKARVNELSAKLNARTNLLGEIDMAGPSLKLYFKNEDERHLVTMVAAQHGMTLPQYVMACTVQNTNEVLKKQQEAMAEQQAAAQQASEEQAKTSADPVDTTNEAELEANQDV